MINKKAIMGIIAVLVIVTTAQGFKPVLADSSMSNFIVSVNSGAGEVCWSGAASGCTSSSTALSLQNGATVTFTATGLNGYQFLDYNIGSSMTSVYAASNPYTVTINGSGEYVSADFTPGYGGGGDSGSS